MRRRALALVGLMAAVALAAAGCGGGGSRATSTSTTAAAPPARTAVTPATDLDPDVAVRYVGEGADGAWVLRPRGSGARRLPVVLFGHGWFATNPQTYGPWVEHLVEDGQEVIYPTYQTPPYASPGTALRSFTAGVRNALALRDAPVDTADLTAVGHSAGGALIADYAATARAQGLPAPIALLSAYPGRKLPRLDPRIPSADLGRVPARTRIEALASPTDRTVGETTARAIVRDTSAVPRNRKRLVIVRSALVGDHLGPQRSDRTSRRTFWSAFDLLAGEARLRRGLRP